MTLLTTLSVATPLLALGMVLPALAATTIATGTAPVSADQQTALEKVHSLNAEAREIAKEAGLSIGGGPGHLLSSEDRQTHDAIHAAIESNDYATFRNLIAGTPFAETITDEAAFNKLVEAEQLRENGDREGARAIFAELGFPRMMGMHEGPGRGGAALFLTKLSPDERDLVREALDLLDSGDTDGAEEVLSTLWQPGDE